jgi:uncharacterized repeat protein (TIGR03837 family)
MTASELDSRPGYHSDSRLAAWDIFCNVIDNYGDIGVCWRLARQLAVEHGCAVRLWVDALDAFARICPELDASCDAQRVQGIEVRRWRDDAFGSGEVRPGDVVVEAFACRLPERFVEAMAVRAPKPVWINLDYLSAEDWVAGCHALPSPHPRLPLTKYFFFPGFVDTTGGLLREHGLDAKRRAFRASPEVQAGFWRHIGQPAPVPGALRISLFAYENPALPDLLTAWANGGREICCLAPVTRTLPAIEAFAGRPLRTGDAVRRGALEIRLLPFVAQDDYDRLLWSCDINCVRGEDSFVRAQWAARPLLWQIYPQQDDAHRVKLDAFLEHYCRGLSAGAGEAVRALHAAWNRTTGDPADASAGDAWRRWSSQLPELREHAERWAKVLSKQQDLCSCLFRFCLSKL